MPSDEAFFKADEFLDELSDMADTHGKTYAPCFRDDLADNREWIRQKLAELIDDLTDCVSGV